MKNYFLSAAALLCFAFLGVSCRPKPSKPAPAAIVKEHLRLAREADTPAARNVERAWAADSLDLDALEETGVWDDYFKAWIALWREDPASPEDPASAEASGSHDSATGFDIRITAAAKKLLTRTVVKFPDRTKPLIRTLCRMLVASRNAAPAAAIAAWPYGLELPGNTYSAIAERLLGALLLVGQRAPAIEGAGLMPSPPPSSTLVFFYESGCRTCGPIMRQLVEAYPKLVAGGVRVITVSSDTDRRKFDNYIADTNMPWPDRLCDFQGFSGLNFRRYSVSSTPTLWVIDGKGILTGHYSNLEDTGLL